MELRTDRQTDGREEEEENSMIYEAMTVPSLLIILTNMDG